MMFRVSLGFHEGFLRVSLRFHLGFLQDSISISGILRVLIGGFIRSSFRFSLGFHARSSYQDCFSRFLNVQAHSLRVSFWVSLGFSWGVHLGFL